MAFIGTPLDTRNTFQSLQGKRFNGDGSTTAFTLDVAPSSVLDIEVFVGNVRQDPNSAYTLSGTTLTFTGAPPSGTNNIYVVHQAKSVGTINAPDNSVDSAQLNTALLTGATDIGADIADADLFLVDDGAGGTLRKTAASRLKTYAGFSVSSITGATELAATPADTDEFVLSDAGTLKRIDFSHIKGNFFSETAFYAHMDSQQNLSQDTASVVTFSQERYDLGSNYNAGTYIYTAPSAGYYRFDVACHVASASDSQLKTTSLFLRFTPSGGSDTDIVPSYYDNEGSRQRRKPHTFGIVRLLAANEAVKVYAYPNVTSGTPVVYYSGTIVENYFSGYRVA
jgi:hypothetical protein